MQTCSSCSSPLEPTAKFCGQCGSLVEQQMRNVSSCWNCGNESSGRFCNDCGSDKSQEPDRVRSVFSGLLQKNLSFSDFWNLFIFVLRKPIHNGILALDEFSSLQIRRALSTAITITLIFYTLEAVLVNFYFELYPAVSSPLFGLKNFVSEVASFAGALFVYHLTLRLLAREKRPLGKTFNLFAIFYVLTVPLVFVTFVVLDVADINLLFQIDMYNAETIDLIRSAMYGVVAVIMLLLFTFYLARLSIGTWQIRSGIAKAASFAALLASATIAFGIDVAPDPLLPNSGVGSSAELPMTSRTYQDGPLLVEFSLPEGFETVEQTVESGNIYGIFSYRYGNISLRLESEYYHMVNDDPDSIQDEFTYFTENANSYVGLTNIESLRISLPGAEGLRFQIQGSDEFGLYIILKEAYITPFNEAIILTAVMERSVSAFFHPLVELFFDSLSISQVASEEQLRSSQFREAAILDVSIGSHDSSSDGYYGFSVMTRFTSIGFSDGLLRLELFNNSSGSPFVTFEQPFTQMADPVISQSTSLFLEYRHFGLSPGTYEVTVQVSAVDDLGVTHAMDRNTRFTYRETVSNLERFAVYPGQLDETGRTGILFRADFHAGPISDANGIAGIHFKDANGNLILSFDPNYDDSAGFLSTWQSFQGGDSRTKTTGLELFIPSDLIPLGMTELYADFKLFDSGLGDYIYRYENIRIEIN